MLDLWGKIAAFWPLAALPLVGYIGFRVYKLWGTVGLSAVVVTAATAFIYWLGGRNQKSVMERQAVEDRLKAAKDRADVDDQVGKLSDDAVHSDLDKWLRDRER
jgi:hypothetical protein